ncbi:MAG TPA: DUF2231 domain-containing protein [Candidatus Acidoferrales bacterium]|nr:DUF2231 domain-containing protein [Candidatus Acidoferrales bacterium]
MPGLNALLNYHPLFVHFPIALWLAALLFEGLALWRANDEWHRTAVRLLYLGTIGGFAALSTGFMAQNSVVPEPDVQSILALHKLLMLITTSVALGLCLYAFAVRDRFDIGKRRLFLVGLVVLAILMVVGTDKGGFLVYHFGQSVNLTTTH